MKSKYYPLGTNVEWLDCESSVPYYTIVNMTIQDDGQKLYYIRHRIQPYTYWVSESRIRFNKKVNRFSTDLTIDPNLKINVKIGCLPKSLDDSPSEIYKAWIDMRHALTTIIVLVCAGILQSFNLR